MAETHGQGMTRHIRAGLWRITDLIRRFVSSSTTARESGEQLDLLYRQLEREFGDQGRRAADFLQTAATQLYRARRRRVPRDAEVVAYCIREALSAVQKAVSGFDHPAARTDRERFSVVSRDVVAAADPLRKGSRREDDVERLLDTVARLETIHGQPTERGDELTRLMLIRSGVAPVSGQGSAVETFNDVGSRVSSGLHAQIELDDAMELFGRATGALMTLFHPPTQRLQQLERLAAHHEPGPAERSKLERLVSTPHHLVHFFRHARSSTWLPLLDGTALVAIPDPPGGPWPVVRFLERHADRDDATITAWLNRGVETARGEDDLAYVAEAARRFGRGGDNALLRVARQSPHNVHVQHTLRRRFEDAPANSAFVTRAVDYLLDPAGVSGPWIDRLGRRYVEGVDADNAPERLEMLTYKLRQWLQQRGNLVLGPGRGSVANQRGRRDPRALVLRAWTQIAGIAVESGDLEALIGLTERLPTDVGVRLRSWLLAQTPDSGGEPLVSGVVDAIERVLPGPDEARLVDRALRVAGRMACIGAWRGVVGAPPSLGTVVSGFGTDAELTERLLRMAWWATVLPEETFHSWQPQLDHVQSQVGRIDQAALERAPTRPRVGSWRSVSPMTVDELRAMEPLDAAAAVGEWQPPDDPNVNEDAGELGYALQQAVEADGERWITAAPEAIRRLSHPMYVRYLVEGLTRSDLDARAWSEQLASIATEVMRREGDVDPLGVGRDADENWQWAADAAASLVKHLAFVGADLGDARDEVWTHLLRRTAPAESPPDDELQESSREPLDQAANASATRALDAALYLAWYEAGRGWAVHPQLFDVLDQVVALSDSQARAWRALLATHIGRFARFAPDWLDRQAGTLFGPAADPDLRRTAVDALLRFARDRGSTWLEARHPDAVNEALHHGLTAAAHLLLHQMLDGVPGKEPEAVIARLLKHNPALLSQSPVALLSDEGDPPEHLDMVLAFWDAALDRSTEPAALYGFGWFADLRGITDSSWAARMLATARAARGDLDVPHRIAERCLEIGPTAESLELVLVLLRATSLTYERYDLAATGAELVRTATSLDSELNEHKTQLRDALLEYGFKELVASDEGSTGP